LNEKQNKNNRLIKKSWNDKRLERTTTTKKCHWKLKEIKKNLSLSFQSIEREREKNICDEDVRERDV
jgi:hypothetical protein